MLVRARRARKPRVIRFRVVLVRGSGLCAFGPAWFGSTLNRAGVPTTRRVGRTRDLIAPPLEVFRRGLRHGLHRAIACLAVLCRRVRATTRSLARGPLPR